LGKRRKAGKNKSKIKRTIFPQTQKKKQGRGTAKRGRDGSIKNRDIGGEMEKNKDS